MAFSAFAAEILVRHTLKGLGRDEARKREGKRSAQHKSACGSLHKTRSNFA
ncbi:hypothetical protein Ga0080559_TMP2831 [Salipiger profundus]|uniref:Uncharacterized protein n=1 Tax=Salipiger profundus TaxID=1229727 RepID=A0A1U7D620_9RHOB|nr:hypothetical protein Ga0080559_TMP2831 [Salipiger profundus]